MSRSGSPSALDRKKWVWKNTSSVRGIMHSVTKYCVSCSVMSDSACSPPGYSVHGIFQAGILEWVAILFSTGRSPPRDWTRVSCIAARFFPLWATNSEHLLKFSLKLDTVALLYVDYLWILTIFWGMELFQGGKEALKDYLHNVLTVSEQQRHFTRD